MVLKKLWGNYPLTDPINLNELLNFVPLFYETNYYAACQTAHIIECLLIFCYGALQELC